MGRLTKPIRILNKAMIRIENGKLGDIIEEEPNNEIKSLVSSFNRMSCSLVELMEKNRQAEEKKREFEIEVLRSQINPHFIFNTLNIIKWMAIVQKCTSISDALTALGNIVVPLFREKDLLGSIEQEIVYMENYIRIINIRYGDGIKIMFDITDEVKQYKILRFLLQPVVENAILHGFENTFDDSTIFITAKVEAEALLISIEDNGKGMTMEKMNELNRILQSNEVNPDNNKGIGMVNSNRRIKLHFGDQYGIKISSEFNKGTKVSMRVPLLL
jgi:sensor histidine kinase YesM